MKSIKRKVGFAMAGLMVAGTIAATPAMAKTVFEKNNSGWAYKYDDEVGVKVNWLIGTEKTSAHVTEVGTKAGYYVTAEGAEKVEYNLWYYDTKGNWVSTGWSEAADAKVPHFIQLPEGQVLEAGMNKVSVWVREAGKEKAHFTNENGSYDAYNYTGVNAKETGFDFGGEAKYSVAGNKLSFKGFEGLENVEYKVNIYNNETGEWANGEFGKNEAELAEGMNLVNVHIDTNKDGKWDAYRLFMVDNTKSAESVEVFTTAVEGLTLGSKVTIAMTEDGKKEFPAAAKYEVFDGEEKITKTTTLGEGTTAFPAKAEGDEVTVKILDANNAVLATVKVALGENGVVVKTPVSSDYEVTATVEPLTLGSKVTVKTVKEYEGVTKFRVFDGEEAVSKITTLGEGTTVFPGKVKGDKVTVKLLNDNNEVVGSVETELQ